MPVRAAGVGGQEQDGLRDFISGAETAIGRACRFALSLLSLWLIDHENRHLIEEFP
jgi:hypothetical protein